MGYKIYGNYEFKETEFTVEEMLKMVNKLKTAVITDYEKNNKVYHVEYNNELYIVDEKLDKVFLVINKNKK